MARAWTVSDIQNAELETLDFKGRWADSFGRPDRYGVILIYGHSGNGKTRFALEMAKYLTEFTNRKVLYNSLEEGLSVSMQRAIADVQMEEVKNRFLFVQEHKGYLLERLRKQRSPDIVFIDSFQYFGLNKREYIKMREEFPKKLFVFISHADGKKPAGRTAEFTKYDAGVKIWVEGYKAIPISRYGGNEEFVIWEKGAERYWGE